MIQLLDIGLPVLAAGLLILASHIPLGHQVLKRGIVFIDLAIAQVAALGTILATQIQLPGYDQFLQQSMAVFFALFGVGLVALIHRIFPDWREAFIGLIYVTAATVLILVVAGHPRGGHVLTNTLSGDILWLVWSDLIPLLVIAVVVQVLSFGWPLLLERFFYLFFAVTITLSVTQAGIYLVFVCLIAPALASVVYNTSKLWSYLVGVSGFVAGLILAWKFDLPAAACIVICVIFSLLMALILQQRSVKGHSI